MPVWAFAKKSVKVFLNFTFGQFFSQPLDDSQIFITPSGIGCRDLYFNTEKINAVLAERGIPIIVCVAYVSELVVCLPSSLEVNGVDFVVQALSGECTPGDDDALFNSMISSMTAAAFAAAKVAGGTTEWFHAQPTADVNDDAGLEESYDDDEEAEDSGGETKPGGLRYRIHQLFERLTSTAVKVDLGDETKNSFVDQESKERVAYMIDSIIAQTSVTLRKVNVRIECQLGLPGLNRASGIALSLAHLHVTNQHQPYQSQPTGDPNHSDETGPSWVRQGNLVDSPRKERPGGDGWSWLWNWAGSRRADPGPNSASAAAAASAGSLSTMLHKNIRLEGLDLFWDLWDTKEQFGCTVSNIRLDQSGADAAEALGTSFSPSRPNGLNTICPTEDNMVASAKLLTLSGMSTARVNLRCPLLSLTQAKPVGQASAIDFTSAEQVTTWPSFEMRVHLDLGAIVACACPSQFYWLQLFIGQLSHIWQNYTNRKTLVPCSDRGSRPASPESPLVTRPGHHQRMVQVVGNGRVDNNQPSHLFRATASEEYRHLAHQLSESELVDLDLSGQNEDAPLVDSKLFWSCLTTTADSTVISTNNETDGTRTRYYGNPDSPNAYSAGIAPGTTTGEPKFSMTANVLCVTLVAFYEDEPVLGTDATIPTHAQSDLCKSVGPASRRTNMPSGRTSSRIESNNSSVVSESEEDSFLDSSSCPVGSFDSHPTHSDTPTPVATEAPESFTVQTLAALPGPFLFFSRFSGLLPWKSPAEFHNGPNNTPTTRPKHNRSTTSLFDTADTAKPMYIDRSEIDTGKMSPTGWVAHLRRQFAELASPRDHLCLVGGLWHVELSSHLVTTRASESYDCCPSGRLQADRCNRTQVDFSAQLFGVEVSECLFPDESVPDLSSTAGMTIVELLSFPDRSAIPGDRTFRTTSSEATAVQCSGLLSYVDSVGMNSQPTAPIAGTVSNHSFRIDLAYCRIEMDLSLLDRIHRITDAIVAASEAVTKFLPLNLLTSVNGMPWWRDEEKKEPTNTRHVAFANFSRNLEEGISFQPPLRSHHVGASSLKQPFSFLEPTVPKPAMCTTFGHLDLAGSFDLNIFCLGLEVVLRFPIPLEAVKLTAPQNLSDLHTKLWNTGIPLWIDKPDSISGTSGLLLSDPDVSPSTRVGLAWWRRTLRPEYLRIILAKLTFGYRTPRIAANTADDPPNKPTPSHAMRRSVGGEIPDVRSGVYSDRRTANASDVGQDVKDREPQLKVTLRLLTVYVANDSSKLQSSPFLQLTAQNTTSDLITVSVHLAPLGRQELVEQQPDVATKLDDLSETSPVFSFSNERFQMGIDLVSLDNPVKHVGPSAPFCGQPSGRPVEWSLWKRTGPKQNPRTPFVIRRSFLQDAPKAHAKQTTYYPGDVNHMAFYRRSASMNTRYAVLCRISTAVIHVDNKQTIDVVYLRLMYDFLLWTSLLPNDRRLRATLTRLRCASSACPESDHRYWFLSDPAPLSFIYAHPEAAKQAAALEANSVHGATARPHGGLHFLPLGDSEDEGDGFQDGQPESDADEDDFDAGLDSIRSRVRNGHRQSAADLHFGYPLESRACSDRKSPHAYNKATNFGQRPSRKKLQIGHSVPRLSDDEDDDENSAYSTTSIDTTVQKQSLFCVQLDLDSVEMHVALPSSVSAQISQDNAVLIKASAVIVFLEANHDGAPNVNYATTELGTFEILFTANPHAKPTAPHPCGPQEEATSSLWWPGLVHFSWTGAGYPLSHSQFSDTDSGVPTNGPMLTFAVRHCQIEHSIATAKTPVYRDEFSCTLRLQDTCLVHWPDLEHTVCTVEADSGLPNWLSHLLHVLQTPSVSVISQLLPGYQLPDTLLIQHIHLEHIALTWSLPEDHTFPVPVRHVPKLTSQIKSIRAIVGCESVSITVNTASETGSASASTSTSPPGTLLLAFLSNATVFLCPIYIKTTPALPLLERFTSQPSQFVSWLNSLCLTDCVCVADLDHLEMRCFSDPIRITQTHGTEAVVSSNTRVDVRSTNNLVRLHTCADSLVALQLLVEALTVSNRCCSCGNVDCCAVMAAGSTANASGVVIPSSVPSPQMTPQAHGLRARLISPARVIGRPPVPGHSFSPHRQIAHRNSFDSSVANGSTSSVEDLLHGAISDVELPGSSPSNKRLVHRNLPPVLNMHRKGGVLSSSPSEVIPDSTIVLEKHRSPEPRPCRTPHSDQQRKTKCPVITSRVDRRSDRYPYSPEVPSAHWNANLQTGSPPSSSSESSPNEFIIVKPSMVPSRLPLPSSPSVEFKWLVPPGDSNNFDITVPSFEVREDHYHLPAVSAYNVRGTKNRMHHLFTDPPSVYPRFDWALTLYNFSLEWNLYGGTDLLTPENDLAQLTSVGNQTATSDPTKDRIHVVTDAHRKSSKTPSPRLPTASEANTKRTYRFRHDVSAVVSLTGTKSSTDLRTTANPEQTSFPKKENAVGASVRRRKPVSSKDLYSKGGRYRDSSKCVCLRLGNVYFRRATFPRLAAGSFGPSNSLSCDPAGRYILNVGSLIILDRVVSSKINQLLYSYRVSATRPSVPHSTDTPMFRMALVCWRVAPDSAVLTQPATNNTHQEESVSSASSEVTASAESCLSDSTAMNPARDDEAEDCELELEAKISCQPLRINLDQNTLQFLEGFQQLFTSLSIQSGQSNPSSFSSQPLTVPVHADFQSPSRSSTPTSRATRHPSSPLQGSPSARATPSNLHSASKRMTTEGMSAPGRPGLFIRKVTFYPDLPIRLDYHGRHLDLTGGSVHGFLRMLLQLHNAELVIPRRVYQRGYPTLDRLLEEVVADMRTTICAQLPQLLATSIGPMHEVTQFLMGLWDLIYQPVQSLYHGSRASSNSSTGDMLKPYWHTADLDLSAYDPSLTGTQQQQSTALVAPSVGAGGFIHGLRSGTRSFSTSTLWATLQLTIQGVRAVQSIAETAYDLVTPGPALRSRQLRLRQPADMREGFGNAMSAVSRGFQMVTEDLLGAAHTQSEVELLGYKGPVGVVGDVLRQIPPTVVAPLVTGCEVTANILGGLRNQLRPEAKLEDEQKWKDTHGL